MEPTVTSVSRLQEMNGREIVGSVRGIRQPASADATS
jgi:hypothetical protein